MIYKGSLNLHNFWALERKFTALEGNEFFWLGNNYSLPYYDNVSVHNQFEAVINETLL